jgi:hypothetical protein
MNAFFVALSRAKVRVAFTYAKTRPLGTATRSQTRKQIRERYDLMNAAGVQLVDVPSPA